MELNVCVCFMEFWNDLTLLFDPPSVNHYRYATVCV